MSVFHIYVWPDASWCWAGDLDAEIRNGKSDDVTGVSLPEWADGIDADYIAIDVANGHEPTAAVSEHFGL